MNILIVYSTNSGSTGSAAELVATTLKEKAHSVTVKQAFETRPQELANYDLLIFGSPSWDYEGKEGQPHEDITNLLKRLDGSSLTGKKYAIFGLGDTSYMHFCGAVEIIESILNGKGTIQLVPSLKIDRYYYRPDSGKKIQEWVDQLATMLQ